MPKMEVPMDRNGSLLAQANDARPNEYFVDLSVFGDESKIPFNAVDLEDARRKARALEVEALTQFLNSPDETQTIGEFIPGPTELEDAEPDTAEPGTTEPDTTEPDTAEPDTAESQTHSATLAFLIGSFSINVDELTGRQKAKLQLDALRLEGRVDLSAHATAKEQREEARRCILQVEKLIKQLKPINENMAFAAGIESSQRPTELAARMLLPLWEIERQNAAIMDDFITIYGKRLRSDHRTSSRVLCRAAIDIWARWADKKPGFEWGSAVSAQQADMNLTFIEAVGGEPAGFNTPLGKFLEACASELKTSYEAWGFNVQRPAMEAIKTWREYRNF